MTEPTPAVAGTAETATGAVAEDSEPFSSFGSWNAISATKRTIRLARTIFFRRSAALRAATRRPPRRASMTLIWTSLLQH